MMSISNSISLKECDLPDEYIDSVISFDAEASTETRELLPAAGDIFRSLVPHHWLHSDNIVTEKPANNHAHVNDMKLSDYDLPDEYVDAAAVISFDDSENLPNPLGAAMDSLNCLHHCIESRAEDCDDVALNDYDLPDEYVSAEVSCSHRDRPNVTEASHVIPSQSLGSLDESIPKILSFDQASGLARRRREYSSKPTNKTSPTPLQNNLTFHLANSQKSAATENRWTTNKENSVDELIPPVKSSNETSSLRKRSRQHQSVM
jgi:hypothetical protein